MSQLNILLGDTKMEEILKELKEIINTGILPDGDHIDVITKIYFEELYSKLSLQAEAKVIPLQDIADTLAMDCLRSTRYQIDPNFKKKVDDVLYLTRDWS